MSGLAHTIDYLRAAAIAPAHELASYGRGVEQMTRVTTSEAGEAASLLAASARGALRQLAHVTPETAKHLRDVCAAFAAALASEAEAHGGLPLPYHQRD
jgi:hypothetical protein